MDALQAAVFHLIERFVQRQQIPFEVIQKFRAHLVDSTKLRSTSKEYISATGRGYWGQANEWQYSLHGGGCRLTHTITGEVIDWDAPDLNRFDPYWFVGWLQWYLSQNTNDQDARIILMAINAQDGQFRNRIFDILEQIHQVGKLYYYPDSTNKYALIV